MNHNVTKEGIEVKAGQVWRDLDKRMRGRQVNVIFAVAGVARVKGGRTTELSISRMHRHSTGWELVSSPTMNSGGTCQHGYKPENCGLCNTRLAPQEG